MKTLSVVFLSGLFAFAVIATAQAASTPVTFEINGEVFDKSCAPADPVRYLSFDSGVNIPKGLENGYIVLTLYDGAKYITGPDLRKYKLSVNVSNLSNHTHNPQEILNLSYINPDGKKIEKTPHDGDEWAIAMDDVQSKTSAGVGDKIEIACAVTDLLTNQAITLVAPGDSVSGPTVSLYVENFNLLEFYSGPTPIPGLYAAAFTTYSYSPFVNQISTEPLMVAWGGKIHLSDNFYLGLSAAGFYQVTPDTVKPANSNLTQACLGIMIDLNNVIDISPLAVTADFSTWPPTPTYTILVSVDPGILNALRH